MTIIAPHLSVDELGARYRAAKDGIEKSHVQAIWLLARGHRKAEVGELLGLLAPMAEPAGRPLQRARPGKPRRSARPQRRRG